MAQNGEFKFIKVNDAEEDVVIHAGLPVEDEGGVTEPAAKAVPEVEPATEPAASPSHEPEPETASAPVPKQTAKPTRKPQSAKAKDGYRETTLDDLHSEPMPTAQKVVIIAAVICIVGALLYYFIFMR